MRLTHSPLPSRPGRLKAELDQGDQSRKHLSTAIDLYRSMGMSSGLRQAEDALAKTTDKL